MIQFLVFIDKIYSKIVIAKWICNIPFPLVSLYLYNKLNAYIPSQIAFVSLDSRFQTESWSISAPGMVFVFESKTYYSSVTNPSNYEYMSQAEASNIAQPTSRRNQYARSYKNKKKECYENF